MRFICEECVSPCIIVFDDPEEAMPSRCPFDGTKAEWNEIFTGDE